MKGFTVTERDRLVAVERDVPGRDGHGNDVPNWQTLCKPWVNIVYASGAERRQAAQDNASQTATFNMLRDSVTATITAADRIVYDGLVWDISNTAHIARGGIAVTAIAQQPGGGI